MINLFHTINTETFHYVLAFPVLNMVIFIIIMASHIYSRNSGSGTRKRVRKIYIKKRWWNVSKGHCTLSQKCSHIKKLIRPHVASIMFTNTSSETFARHKKFRPGSCIFTSIASILIGKVDEYKTTTTTTKYAYYNFGLSVQGLQGIWSLNQNLSPRQKCTWKFTYLCEPDSQQEHIH